MKKLLVYLSAIGVSLAILPVQADAGSRHKKKDRFWARHYGYSPREHYRHYRHYGPYYYWRYQHYYGYQRYPYWYYGYGGRCGLGFRLQFD